MSAQLTALFFSAQLFDMMPICASLSTTSGSGYLVATSTVKSSTLRISPTEVKLLPTFEPLPRARSKENRSEEHTSELQSLMRISYAVFCLKKKKNISDKKHATNNRTQKTH